jgi:hypothetical protein
MVRTTRTFTATSRYCYSLFLVLLPRLTGAFHTQSRAFVRSSSIAMSARFSNPDQEARFAAAKKENNQRFLDITTVYDPSFLKGKRVAITGANRGIGLEIAKQVTEAGAKLVALVRSTSDELEALKPDEVIKNVDVRNDETCEDIKNQIKGGPIDIVSLSL